MILAKTPLRVSFFGGGSDISSFYERQPGACLSTTINKYMYITVCKTSLNGVKAIYNSIEVTEDVEELKHDRIKNVLKAFSIAKNIEIASFSEIPTKGTGLGSSSAFTVGLIDAIYRYQDLPTPSRFDLAEAACDIEINWCKDPIGKQDQYAAAFGGLNLFTFNTDGVVDVSPVPASSSTITRLKSNLMLFYTGITRSAANILQEQSANDKNHEVRELVKLAHDAYKSIRTGKLDDFGDMLDYSWNIKRSLASGISSGQLDDYYSDIKKAGALGGKILGAGGGGYFLFYVPDDISKKKVLEKAKRIGLKHFDFNFDNDGSRVVYAN